MIFNAVYETPLWRVYDVLVEGTDSAERVTEYDLEADGTECDKEHSTLEEQILAALDEAARTLFLPLPEQVERWNEEPLERRREILAAMIGAPAVPGDEIEDVRFEYTGTDENGTPCITANARFRRAVEQVQFTVVKSC